MYWFLLLLLVLPFPAGAEPSWQFPPRYAALTATASPQSLQLEAGGAEPVTLPGKDCTGYLNAAQPDVNLTLAQAGDTLHLSVVAKRDTALVIFTPDQRWVCADDSPTGGLNPELALSSSLAGVYNLWIAGDQPDSVTEAQLDFWVTPAARGPEAGE